MTKLSELEPLISIKEAARLRNVSPDTLRRNFPNLIIQVSQRRQAVRMSELLTAVASR